jgi:hypothetical protein
MEGYQGRCQDQTHAGAGPERVIDAYIEAKLLPFYKQPLRDMLMIMRDSRMRNQKEVFIMRWEHVDWANSRYFV